MQFIFNLYTSELSVYVEQATKYDDYFGVHLQV